MLTFHKNKETVLLGHILEKNKRKPLYWHPKRDDELLIPPDFDSYFASKKFRNKYRLSKPEVEQIVPAIYDDEPLEKGPIKNKFFKIRDDLETSAYTELRLQAGMEFIPQYFAEDKTAWPGTFMVTGASGSGKGYWILNELIKPNLDGPRKNKRKFLYLSAEANVDKTIINSGLKKQKYQNWIQFVDISESGMQSTEYKEPQEFFDKYVMPKIKYLPPGSLVILDDYMDSVIPHQLRHFSNKALRTYRHKGIGCLLVLHSIKSGLFSSQSHNSVKGFVLYPRSSFYKIKQWLKDDVNMSPSEIQILNEMKEKARSLYLHVHTPNYIANKRIVKLF